MSKLTNKLIEQNELASKIALSLNGNTVQYNLSVLRSIKYILKNHSIFNTTSDELKKEHEIFKKNVI